jgi:N4-gp56 family major capsid protein
MAGPTDTATTNFNNWVQELINKNLEDLLRGKLAHLLPGNYIVANLVKGSNATMRFLNAPDMSVTAGTPSAGTPPWLTEGTPPTAEELVLGFEEFTASQAGRTLSLSDVAAMESPVDLAAVSAERIARNMAETADLRVANVLGAGTSVIYAGTGNLARTDVGVGDLLLGADVKRAVANLRATNVPSFSNGYRAIVHPFVAADLMADTEDGGWIDANRYAGSAAIFEGELGRYSGVTFVESSKAVKFAAGGAGSIDVYSTIVLGTEAYAFGDFGARNVYVTPPGGHTDPLHQLAIFGWKAMFGAMIVGEGANAASASDNRYLRIESATGIVAA